MTKLTLRVGYSHNEPIALRDLTESLNSFAKEYRSVQKRVASKFEDAKAELYVTKIREGSIIAEMTPYIMTGGMALIENTNTVVDFCTHLRDGFDFFLGRVKQWRTGDKKSAEHLAKMVEPIAKEIGSQMNFHAPVDLRGATFNVTINHFAAKEIKRTSKIYTQSLDAPGTHVFDEIELFWYQARNDTVSKAGDRAIVPQLSDKPVKVIFSTDAIKARMLSDESNPFLMNYVVDVVADFKGRFPKQYLITKVHSTKHR